MSTSTPLRMGELVATLALAQDNAFGQPLESQLRSCLLAVWMSEEAGFDPELRDTVYWVALLRYIGCTGHAHEVATLFGDEIAIRAQTLVHDAANPAEVIGDVITFATAGKAPEEREQIIAMIQGAGFKILGMKLPHIELYVRPGRDIARLVEVAALTQALKKMGHDPAKDFNDRLIRFMTEQAKQPAPTKIKPIDREEDAHAR